MSYDTNQRNGYISGECCWRNWSAFCGDIQHLVSYCLCLPAPGIHFTTTLTVSIEIAKEQLLLTSYFVINFRNDMHDSCDMNNPALPPEFHNSALMEHGQWTKCIPLDIWGRDDMQKDLECRAYS